MPATDCLKKSEMPIKFELKQLVESFLKDQIIGIKPVSGGCIANSKVLTTKSGLHYFLKSLPGTSGMFLKEANGLRELAKAKCIKIPEVILADTDFLLLEFIEQGSKTTHFFESFGAAFAKMHRFTGSSFGFFEDNYLGASPQYNIVQGIVQSNWADFYWTKRLLPQLKMAEQNGLASGELLRAMHKLEPILDNILSQINEPPTLLHGDLWAGNYMCNAKGEAVLIDPAVYYGHREVDLAMTKMFGGFSPDFYKSYQETYPLPDGWEYRENLYLLYHYLNHLNLFGGGYLGSALRLIQSYL
jgi:fructosamine-3-kinase